MVRNQLECPALLETENDFKEPKEFLKEIFTDSREDSLEDNLPKDKKPPAQLSFPKEHKFTAYMMRCTEQYHTDRYLKKRLDVLLPHSTRLHQKGLLSIAHAWK